MLTLDNVRKAVEELLLKEDCTKYKLILWAYGKVEAVSADYQIKSYKCVPSAYELADGNIALPEDPLTRLNTHDDPVVLALDALTIINQTGLYGKALELMDQKEADMKYYIFYTEEGYTTTPNNEDIDNCQVLGWEYGRTKDEAFKTLLKNRPWITESGYDPDYIKSYQIV